MENYTNKNNRETDKKPFASLEEKLSFAKNQLLPNKKEVEKTRSHFDVKPSKETLIKMTWAASYYLTSLQNVAELEMKMEEATRQ